MGMTVSIVGGAFFATMALTTVENASASAAVSVGKIGPGYARMPPADFGKLIAADIEKWGKVVKASGAKPE